MAAPVAILMKRSCPAQASQNSMRAIFLSSMLQLPGLQFAKSSCLSSNEWLILGGQGFDLASFRFRKNGGDRRHRFAASVQKPPTASPCDLPHGRQHAALLLQRTRILIEPSIVNRFPDRVIVPEAQRQHPQQFCHRARPHLGRISSYLAQPRVDIASARRVCSLITWPRTHRHNGMFMPGRKA